MSHTIGGTGEGVPKESTRSLREGSFERCLVPSTHLSTVCMKWDTQGPKERDKRRNLTNKFVSVSGECVCLKLQERVTDVKLDSYRFSAW